MGESVVAINELTKHYGKHRGVEKVTFSVEEGDIFGFLGPTVRANLRP